MFTKLILFPLILATILDNPVTICVSKTSREKQKRFPQLGVNFLDRPSKPSRKSSKPPLRLPTPVWSVSSDSSDDGANVSQREFQRMANAFIRFNREEEARINYNINGLDLMVLRESMIALANDDQCAKFNFGRRTGRSNCIVAFREFKTIPRFLRGDACAGAYLATCCRLVPGGPKRCAFFVKTSPGEISPVQGNWRHIEECANAIRMDYFAGTIFGPNQMMMDLGRK